MPWASICIVLQVSLVFVLSPPDISSLAEGGISTWVHQECVMRPGNLWHFLDWLKEIFPTGLDLRDMAKNKSCSCPSIVGCFIGIILPVLEPHEVELYVLPQNTVALLAIWLDLLLNCGCGGGGGRVNSHWPISSSKMAIICLICMCILERDNQISKWTRPVSQQALQ